MMILSGGISMKPRRRRTAMRPQPKPAWPPPRRNRSAGRRRATALGISYRQYVLEIMERGRYLSKDDLN
jgi:hypothetical protein